jgi:hypothetical protein
MFFNFVLYCFIPNLLLYRRLDPANYAGFMLMQRSILTFNPVRFRCADMKPLLSIFHLMMGLDGRCEVRLPLSHILRCRIDSRKCLQIESISLPVTTISAGTPSFLQQDLGIGCLTVLPVGQVRDVITPHGVYKCIFLRIFEQIDKYISLSYNSDRLCHVALS